MNNLIDKKTGRVYASMHDGLVYTDGNDILINEDMLIGLIRIQAEKYKLGEIVELALNPGEMKSLLELLEREIIMRCDDGIVEDIRDYVTIMAKLYTIQEAVEETEKGEGTNEKEIRIIE